MSEVDTEFLRSQVDQTRDIGMEFAADLAEEYIPALCDEVDALRARLAAAEAQLAEAHENLVDVMNQSCQAGEFFDTMCMSAYEGAAEYLVKVGIFEDCNDEPQVGAHGRVMRFYKMRQEVTE